MPLVKKKLGAACKGVFVERGLGGVTPGTPPAFVAMGHALFDSVESFQFAFEPHAAELMGDVSNFTSIEPIIQISEVKV